MFDVIQNRRVLFGVGAIDRLGALLAAEHYRSVFVLAFRREAPCVQKTLEALEEARIPYVLDASLHGEPSTLDIDRIAAAARAAKPDAVLAVGGGSTMDAAKAVAMLATNEGGIEPYQMEGKPIATPALPFFAVPTTSGTGSEATKVSVVYNPKNHLKKSFYDRSMIAQAVVLDPQLVVDLRRDVTVSTGVDALSHAIESYVSLDATPYTEMFSLQAMRLVCQSLETCAAHPHDLQARGDMMLASYFGGCALNAGIGLAHIIAQPLGGLIHIPHGVACAIYLPYAMRYNVEYSTAKYCDIARVFGASGETGLALAREGIARVEALLARLGAPNSIADYVDETFSIDAAVDAVRGATGHIACNPRPVTREAIYEGIRQSIRKGV